MVLERASDAGAVILAVEPPATINNERKYAPTWHDSYCYTKYDVMLSPAFIRREASSASLCTTYAGSSHGCASASASSLRAPVVKMEVDNNIEDALLARVRSGDYVEDVDLVMVTAQLEEKGVEFAPGDFVDDTYLPTFIALVTENSRCDASKKEDWR
jgi:hypothetical protein